MSESEILAVLKNQMDGLKWVMRTLLIVVISLIGTVITLSWNISPKINQIETNKACMEHILDYVKINEEGIYIMMDAFSNVHADSKDPKKIWNEYVYRQVTMRGKSKENKNE